MNLFPGRGRFHDRSGFRQPLLILLQHNTEFITIHKPIECLLASKAR